MDPEEHLDVLVVRPCPTCGQDCCYDESEKPCPCDVCLSIGYDKLRAEATALRESLRWAMEFNEDAPVEFKLNPYEEYTTGLNKAGCEYKSVRCFYCRQSDKEHYLNVTHTPDCPYAKAKKLLSDHIPDVGKKVEEGSDE